MKELFKARSFFVAKKRPLRKCVGVGKIKARKENWEFWQIRPVLLHLRAQFPYQWHRNPNLFCEPKFKKG